VPVQIATGIYEGIFFDAATIDLDSIKFGHEEALKSHTNGHLEDVDGDGDLDMILHFNTQEIGIACDDTEVFLTGKTSEGLYFIGSEDIHTAGCKQK
jgi:hypothetical protein